MAQKTPYSTNYTELETIGRGNFGSATLVRAHDDNNIYVAKKVLLSGLSQKEADGAHMEVNLLRELKHPHIVEYRDSFVEANVLIIIMEYCEEGDLAHFIKKREQKGEPLEEKLVLNWFLQILLALEFVHRRKILHRDIKSSNIFLRSNGTVKLGDFGISRVLENTNEAALTVVGTPYYMSPEVCENKPYTFKSDVWALGCVIYEMCTLKHAFSASNLLGLVYKIVREQNEPIPTSTYSQGLSQLVQKLLNKNVQFRPSIRDIFMEPLVQKTIEEFIRTDGQFTTMLKIPVKKTQLHNEMKKNNAGPGPQGGNTDRTQGGNQTLMSIVQNSSTAKQIENETPQQRMARRKEEARRAEEEKMKAAARESHLARNQDKDRKNRELSGNNPLTGTKSVANMQSSKAQLNAGAPNNYNSPVRVSNQYDNNQIAYQQQYGGQSQVRQSNMGFDNYDPQANTLHTMASVSNASAFGGNNDYGTMQKGFMENTNLSLNYSQSQGTLMSKVNQGTYQHNQFGNNYNNNPTGYGNQGRFAVNNGTGASAYTIKTEMELPTGTNYGGTALYKAPVHDERPLPALQNKNANYIAEDDEELYAEDFDEYEEEFEEYWSDEEDNDKRLTVKANQNDLVDVMKLYKEKLNLGNNSNSTEDDFRETAQESMLSQPEQMSKSNKSAIQNAALTKRQQQIDILRTRAKQDLGVKVFEEAYNYLKKQRQLNTPDKKIQEDLGGIVGKKNLTHCFTIDQIIFLELESM